MGKMLQKSKFTFSLIATLNLVSANFFTNLFSDDNMKSSHLTDKTKYGAPVMGIDPLLDSIKSSWIVFGKETCPFARKAVSLIKSSGETMTFFNKEKEMKEVYEKLKGMLGHDTIPLVIHNGTFVGGYTQTLEYFHKDDKEVNGNDAFEDEETRHAKGYYASL